MPNKINSEVDLSIIIISYNTSKLTIDCLKSLSFVLKKDKEFHSEIIVVDNASSDDSVEMLKRYTLHVTRNTKQIRFKIIENKKNLGFGRANNLGVEVAKGKHILLLNSDTLIENVNFRSLIEYLNANPKIGILTVQVRFPHGPIDPASHRGFPTPYRSFCYFSGLEKLTQNTFFSKIFGGYHLTHMDLSKTHEIDCPSGAFFLMPTSLYKKLGGFDEKFFMYGEDVDLAYRAKELGYKVVYYPDFVILHLKHQSGLQSSPETRLKTKKHFYDAMKIFYKKHYAKEYPEFINKLVYGAINIKEKL